jgi:hypothetical protein
MQEICLESSRRTTESATICIDRATIRDNLEEACNEVELREAKGHCEALYRGMYSCSNNSRKTNQGFSSIKVHRALGSDRGFGSIIYGGFSSITTTDGLGLYKYIEIVNYTHQIQIYSPFIYIPIGCHNPGVVGVRVRVTDFRRRGQYVIAAAIAHQRKRFT